MTNRKISTKAMIIFLLIPVAFLLLLEFIARFIIPVKTIPKIHAQTQRDPYKKELSSPGIVNLEADNNKMFFQTLPNEPFHEPDDILFYRLRRNFTFSWTHTDNSSNTYQTNSLGFRGEEFLPQKSPKKIRIICAGDSSTFGFFANICDTYPVLLKNLLLTKTAEKNAEVINAGDLGYSSYQGLKQFETRLRNLEPDIIIASWGRNDANETLFPDAKVKVGTLKTLDFNSMLNHIALYRLLDNAITNIRKKADASPRMYPRVSMPEYSENLQKLASYSKADGIHLILIPISAPFNYYETMKEIAKNNDNVGFIDIEKIFSSHYDKFMKEDISGYAKKCKWKLTRHVASADQQKKLGSNEMTRIREWNYLFMDYCHPTPVGYQIIAESLYDYLIQHGFFKKAEGKTPKIPPVQKLKKIG